MQATLAIQRALRGGLESPAHKPAGRRGHVIEGSSRVVETKARARPASRFVTRSYTNSAGTRDYKIYIPATHHGQALPLVVMLHGCKQGPDDFAAATRMNALAEEHGFAVAYPQQINKANASNCWNWFEGKHQQRDRGEPSLIAGITREVVSAFGLDARRVYVAGLSAGGAMAVVMATTYPDVYAAAGIHSGLAYAVARDVPSAFAAMSGNAGTTVKRKAPANLPRTVPIIVFHGDRDATVHPSNSDDLIAQASSQSASAGAFAAAKPSVQRGDANGRAYTRTTHFDSAGKASIIEQWLVHGATHAWSGGSAEGSYSDPAGPDASREMIRFFLQHENTLDRS